MHQERFTMLANRKEMKQFNERYLKCPIHVTHIKNTFLIQTYYFCNIAQHNGYELYVLELSSNSILIFPKIYLN